MKVQAEVNRLALQLGLRERDVIVPFSRTDDGGSHLEIDEQGYHWIATERGQTYSDDVTKDLDELLYWIMRDVTRGMATAFELEHRRPQEDCRRQIFAKDVELLARLSPVWAERRTLEYADVLAEYPFASDRS